MFFSFNTIYKKWFLVIFHLFGPILFVGFTRLLTFNYSSRREVWILIIIIDLLVGLWTLLTMVAIRNARLYHLYLSVEILGIAAPIIYATFVILRTDYTNSFQHIFFLLTMIMIMEWAISFFYLKNKLCNAIKLKIPNNSIDVDNGNMDLQKTLLYSPKDADESRVEKILAIGGILMCFAPAIGVIISRSFSLTQQSVFLISLLGFFCIFFMYASGGQAGVARAIKEVEIIENKKIVIKKLE
jgi:hypothetical protein